MELRQVTEGRTKLLVPIREADTRLFYNPRSEINRDITCLVAKSLNVSRFADVLAGVGARGIRVANEVKIDVHLNDINPLAYKVIRRNAELNNLDVKISNLDANLFMQMNRNEFDFIDVDPFGSPVFFLDNALMCVKKNGYVAVTATDTAPLCGVYPETCFRKYSSLPLRNEFCKEIGLRILIGYIARSAAKYRKGIEVVFSQATDHYYRVFIKTVKGRQKADISLKNLGYLYYCKKCMKYKYKNGFLPEDELCEVCKTKMTVSGILWLGKLKENKIVKKMIEVNYLEKKRLKKLLEIVKNEIDVPFFYDVHSICKKIKMRVPPLDYIINSLKEIGYQASRTHISPTGIKTDADIKTVESTIKSFSS